MQNDVTRWGTARGSPACPQWRSVPPAAASAHKRRAVIVPRVFGLGHGHKETKDEEIEAKVTAGDKHHGQAKTIKEKKHSKVETNGGAHPIVGTLKTAVDMLTGLATLYPFLIALFTLGAALRVVLKRWLTRRQLRQAANARAAAHGLKHGGATHTHSTQPIKPQLAAGSDIKMEPQTLTHHSAEVESADPLDTSLAQGKLDVPELVGKYEMLDHRLDQLEHAVQEVLKDIKSGKVAKGSDNGAGGEGEGEQEGSMDLDPGQSLNQLQSAITEMVNSGYLESVKQIREVLMVQEWEINGKYLAKRAGVAAFEKHCTEIPPVPPPEKGFPAPPFSFDEITELYKDPDELGVIKNEKYRMLARSFIEQTVSVKYRETWGDCTSQARELAKLRFSDMVGNSGIADLAKNLGAAVPSIGQLLASGRGK